MTPMKTVLKSVTALGIMALLPASLTTSASAGNGLQPETTQRKETPAPVGTEQPTLKNPLQKAQERIERQRAKKPDSSTTANKVVPGKKREFVGLPIFTADGQRIGRVSDIEIGTDGKVSSIRAKVGGFFGFGAKLVEIPAGSFQKSGKAVKLAMTSKQADDLPAVNKAKTKS